MRYSHVTMEKNNKPHHEVFMIRIDDPLKLMDKGIDTFIDIVVDVCLTDVDDIIAALNEEIWYTAIDNNVLKIHVKGEKTYRCFNLLSSRTEIIIQENKNVKSEDGSES